MRSTRHLPAALALAALVGGAVLLPAPTVPQVSAGAAAPDLEMAPLNTYRVRYVNGRKVLRFTAMMVNTGSRHFEVCGRRASTSEPMQVSQVIHPNTNRYGACPTPNNIPANVQLIPTDALASYAGDGHNHWHVNEMMRYDLWGGSGTFRGAKVGFCFLDSDLYTSSLPGYSGGWYNGVGCSTNPAAMSNRMGISIGMGDEYPWDFAWQWIDITGLPNGDYTVRAKVDPYGFFVEEDEGNNCWYTTVRINGNSVTALTADDVCVDDWSGSPFALDITWAFEAGITVGCAPDLFCTNNPVTREQMATFLYRAVGGPEATQDFFTDDEGSDHEPNINRVAESGITTGCGGTRFCPTATVTRGQMASFLVRAYDLPPTGTDHFGDDEGSIHEADINAVAEAGITTGCASGSFCPNSAVTRGQMVAFLHRAETD